jgi:hypothetical protein
VDLGIFDGMTPEELRRYVRFLLRHYRLVDSLWFLGVAEKFDQSTAESLNEQVWEKAGAVAAREIVKELGVDEKGLSGFVRALRYFPWTCIIGYDISRTDSEVLIEVPSCPTQEARKRRGLDEYVCKQMHYREFAAFAKSIDERIRVECLFAPPDPHPQDCYCRWRFYLINQ